MDRKKIFSDRLKQYRRELNYSVEDVAARLNDMGISITSKTIYAWESGRNQPTTDALMCLSHIYKLNSVLDAFGYPIDSSEDNLQIETITKEEHSLIKALRAHPELKDKVFMICDINDIDII